MLVAEGQLIQVLLNTVVGSADPLLKLFSADLDLFDVSFVVCMPMELVVHIRDIEVVQEQVFDLTVVYGQFETCLKVLGEFDQMLA